MSNFKSVELFSPAVMNHTCFLPDLPNTRLWHTSDGTPSGVYICGGMFIIIGVNINHTSIQRSGQYS